MSEELQPTNPYSYENEKRGTELLASNLVTIAEMFEPKDMIDYFNDVLADVHEEVPLGERQAILNLLAGEQRKAMQERLLLTGKEVIEDISTRNQLTDEEINKRGRTSSRSANDLLDDHQNLVGHKIRVNESPGSILRGHEYLEEPVRRLISCTVSQSEVMLEWRNKNRIKVDNFSENLQNSKKQDNALKEAEKTVEPDFKGEAKDLSSVIEETVKNKTAQKIYESILQAKSEGKNPQEAVFKFLLEKRPKELATTELKLLADFADQYDSNAFKEARRVSQATEEIGILLKRFISKGNDDYRYARRNEEVSDIYRQQIHLILRATEETSKIAPMSVKILENERSELLKLKKRLLQAEQVELKINSTDS